jgi:hypothetical protein
MNSLWDIRIFLGLVPKESPCTLRQLNTLSNFTASLFKVHFNIILFSAVRFKA